MLVVAVVAVAAVAPVAAIAVVAAVAAYVFEDQAYFSLDSNQEKFWFAA